MLNNPSYIIDLKLVPDLDSIKINDTLDCNIILDTLENTSFKLTIQYNIETDTFNIISINNYPVIENNNTSFIIDSSKLKITKL